MIVGKAVKNACKSISKPSFSGKVLARSFALKTSSSFNLKQISQFQIKFPTSHRLTWGALPMQKRQFASVPQGKPQPGQQIFKKQEPPQQTPANEEATEEAEEPMVVEITYSNFMQYVMQSKVPVLLDCYANWCEPCKILTPKLLKAVEEANGGLRLAKLNTDNNPELAEQLQITSLPTVYSFYNGRPLNKFIGVIKDEQLKEFIDEVLKKGGAESVVQHLQQAEQLLKANKLKEATEVYSLIFQQKHWKAEAPALAGLVRCSIMDKQMDVAKQLVDTLKERFPKELDHPEVKKALIAYDLATSAAPAGAELQKLIETVKKDPKDLNARQNLAEAYFKEGKSSQALDECFASIKIDKHWNDQAARKLVMKIFDALGPSDPLTKAGRKKFSSVWFV